MALVTKVSPSLDLNTAKNAPQITGLFAGEALDICAPCYIASGDGLVYMSNSTAADEEAEVAGWTGRAVGIGEPVTLFGYGTRMRYAAGLTPGNIYYLGTTNGRIDTASQVGDAQGVAIALTATDILVTRMQPSTLNVVSDGSLTGTKVATVANANVIGGLPVLFRISTAGGATANTDVVTTHKIRILDAWVVNKAAGTAGDTIQIFEGANAISDAMDINKADQTITRAGTLDDAQYELTAGQTLRVTETDGAGVDSPATEVYVLAIRVA